MIIYLGSDHAGRTQVNKLCEHLNALNYNAVNCNIDDSDKVDYPIIAQQISEKVLNEKTSLGIIICGTGIGVSIQANRNKKIRAAIIYDDFTANSAKEHNNANIICLGSRTQDINTMIKYIDIFLNSKYDLSIPENIRHETRIKMLDE